jgi:hypothetical protein
LVSILSCLSEGIVRLLYVSFVRPLEVGPYVRTVLVVSACVRVCAFGF